MFCSMKSKADNRPRQGWKPLTRGVLSAALVVIAAESRADWKTDANTRIEQIRKRDWTLRVFDISGQPVAGAGVSLRQRRHQFGFGCALNSYPLIDEPRYADFFSRNFEWLVCENETKWTSDEPVQGQVDYRRPDLMLAFGRKRGLLARGHCIFWEATGGGYEHPAWLDALGAPQLSAAVDARLASVVSYYRGSFEHWDINNEMLHGNYFRGRLGNATCCDS
jgi:endo-1,4-beta-xylanase